MNNKEYLAQIEWELGKWGIGLSSIDKQSILQNPDRFRLRWVPGWIQLMAGDAVWAEYSTLSSYSK